MGAPALRPLERRPVGARARPPRGPRSRPLRRPRMARHHAIPAPRPAPAVPAADPDGQPVSGDERPHLRPPGRAWRHLLLQPGRHQSRGRPGRADPERPALPPRPRSDHRHGPVRMRCHMVRIDRTRRRRQRRGGGRRDWRERRCTDRVRRLRQRCAGTLPSGASVPTGVAGLGAHTFTVNATSDGGSSSVSHDYSVVFGFVGT